MILKHISSVLIASELDIIVINSCRQFFIKNIGKKLFKMYDSSCLKNNHKLK